VLERVVIGVLVAGLLWFGSVIVRLENVHYAARLGICDYGDGAGEPLRAIVERNRCYDTTETRTSAAWHLYYALTGHGTIKD
jgi:hypothetical protein